MPRRDDDDEDYDDDDDPPRRRRRRLRDEEDDDDGADDFSGGKLIPRNAPALCAYYGGFVGLILVLASLALALATFGEFLPKVCIPIALGVDALGVLICPVAIILGLFGMRREGGGHAVTGIIIAIGAGLLGVLLFGGVGYVMWITA
jgi:hypothetical protein